MIRALPVAAALLLAVPAAQAQSHADHAGHGAAPQAAASPGCTPEHAAMGHCTPSTTTPAAPAPAPAPVPEPGKAAAPSAVPADLADRHWDPAAMAAARAAMYREHGSGSFSKVTLDLAEVKFSGGSESYKWEADAWFGGDIDRLALKTEGEGAFGGGLEDVELTALYSRAIGPYFNLQAGLRHDIRPDPSRTHLVVGVEGLAPYWFEVDGYLYLSTRGELRAGLAAEYDQRLTQKLILQPKVELDLSAQDIRELGIGSGLTGVEFGLRLRYEFAREFAPYIGVVHESRVGRTADFARAAGKHVSSTGFVIGLRAWF